MGLMKELVHIVTEKFTVKRGDSGALAMLLAGGCIIVALVNLIIIMAK